jgi:hypothetical protein
MQIMIARGPHVERRLDLKLRLEFREILLVDGNRLGSGRRVIDLNTDQEQPTGARDAFDLGEGLLKVIDMIQRVQTSDNVEVAVGE